MQFLLSYIMAGGAGRRLWPISSNCYPKQFLKLLSVDHSLLQDTVIRHYKLCPSILTKRRYISLIEKQLDQISYRANIIAEPAQDSTLSSAIIAAQDAIGKKGNDAIVGLFPIDHIIGDVRQYDEAIEQAYQAAMRYKTLILIGVPAVQPKVGYGYILPGKKISDNPAIFDIMDFCEKPSFVKAQHYHELNYLWNCGIFIFHAQNFLHEITQLSCTPFETFEEGYCSKTNNKILIPCKFSWSDIGTWPNLLEFYQQSYPAIIINKPWGREYILQIECIKPYVIKRIIINPGHRTSLQWHQFRCEYIYILKGQAKLRINDEYLFLSPEQNAYIVQNALHRLENDSEQLLEILEVQIGDIDSNDIVRLEDDYGRHSKKTPLHYKYKFDFNLK